MPRKKRRSLDARPVPNLNTHPEHIYAHAPIWELWNEYAARYSDTTPEVTMFRQGDPVSCGGACVYLMIRGRAVVYVGQSNQLAMRMDRHYHRDWERLAITRMPEWWPWGERRSWMDAMESAAIARFAPPRNIREVRSFSQSSAILAPMLARLPDEW